MQALISPEETDIGYISSWRKGEPATPVFSFYPDSCRVAQVEEDATTYPVGGSLFWIPCDVDVVADRFYFDNKTNTILPIVDLGMGGSPAQPTSTGTQTL